MRDHVLLLVAREGWPLQALHEQLSGQVGCEVHTTHSAEAALRLAVMLRPSVLLVVTDLPDRDPLELCRRIREELPVPPLMLLAPDARALAGMPGDDGVDERELPEIADPLALAEGLAALLGGSAGGNHGAQRLAMQGLVIDQQRHVATIDGRELPLTVTEFRILWTLARQAGYVVSRKELTEVLRNGSDAVQERTVDVHIKAIRQKLAGRAELVETVRGIGYRFRDVSPVATR